jgi:hypothetical protein
LPADPTPDLVKQDDMPVAQNQVNAKDVIPAPADQTQTNTTNAADVIEHSEENEANGASANVNAAATSDLSVPAEQTHQVVNATVEANEAGTDVSTTTVPGLVKQNDAPVAQDQDQVQANAINAIDVIEHGETNETDETGTSGTNAATTPDLAVPEEQTHQVINATVKQIQPNADTTNETSGKDTTDVIERGEANEANEVGADVNAAATDVPAVLDSAVPSDQVTDKINTSAVATSDLTTPADPAQANATLVNNGNVNNGEAKITILVQVTWIIKLVNAIKRFLNFITRGHYKMSIEIPEVPVANDKKDPLLAVTDQSCPEKIMLNSDER